MGNGWGAPLGTARHGSRPAASRPELRTLKQGCRAPADGRAVDRLARTQVHCKNTPDTRTPDTILRHASDTQTRVTHSDTQLHKRRPVTLPQ